MTSASKNGLNMKKSFKEYHQFTEEEFKHLWKNCLFIFDTNTLLNMYRYSRGTVETYFKVLNELKNKKQLWIPYQVGYEFYENRIDVIAEYEGSYDSILSILEKAKSDIEAKYKDHPFLDLCDIKRKIEVGLSDVDKQIKETKKTHPKWMEKDDVLDQINNLFEDSIGKNYEEEKIISIKKEGRDRYDKKIPPGFKDDKKPDEKKFGDLILWYQIIDKAKESNKPIILVSGDVKEDWWLEKGGKRLMPLPQLKKEILEKTGMDFHIYTADRFLEYYTKELDTIIDKKTITEVRKIRELEEKRMMNRRIELMEMKKLYHNNSQMFEKNSMEFMYQFEIINELMMRIDQEIIHPKYKEELDHLFYKLREFKNKIAHGERDKTCYIKFGKYNDEFLFIIDKLVHSEEFHPELSMKIKRSIERLEQINNKNRNYIY